MVEGEPTVGGLYRHEGSFLRENTYLDAVK